MYKISEYIPEDARKAACEFNYEDDEYCPLGYVLVYLQNDDSWVVRHPRSWIFSDAIIVNLGLTDRMSEIEKASFFDECEQAAHEFMLAWDNHEITNLREALGVE